MALAIGASVYGVSGPAGALDGSLRGAQGTGVGTFVNLGTSICNPDGSGEIHYTASNPLSGTLGVSMTTSAVITLGSAREDGRNVISAFSGTFTIMGGAEPISGTLTLAPPRQSTPGGNTSFMNRATCTVTNDDASFWVTARFVASDSAGVFEEGFVKLGGTNFGTYGYTNFATSEFWVAPTVRIHTSPEIDEAGMLGSSRNPPENKGGLPVYISVFPAPIDPLEIRLITTDDTAIAGLDYTSFDETILIPGTLVDEYDVFQSVVVELNDDSDVEGTEQFNATVELLDGRAFFETMSVAAQIFDNDSTTVSIADVSILEGNWPDYPIVRVEMIASAPVTALVYACFAVVSGGTATPFPDDGTLDWDYFLLNRECNTTAGGRGVGITLYPGKKNFPTDLMNLLADDVFESDETIEFAVDWIWGATIVGDGTFTVTILNDDPEPSTDADGDGVVDVIGGVTPGSFDDREGTIGQIVTVPNGWSVAVSDAPDPDGVRVVVGGTGTEKVTLSVCGGFTLKLSVGSDVVITCGSVTVKVAAGSVDVELASGLASVTIPAGAEVKIDTASSGGFVVNVLSVLQTNPVIVTVDGVVSSIGAAGTKTVRAWDFVGFDRPIDGGGAVNSVKAGRAVPLKWRLLDATGAPVLDLASAAVTFLATSCSGGSADPVDATVTVGSGLQNLGNGWYQLNWKTPKAKGCGTMQLDIGDGVLHTAKFQLT